MDDHVAEAVNRLVLCADVDNSWEISFTEKLSERRDFAGASKEVGVVLHCRCSHFWNHMGQCWDIHDS